MTRLYLDAGRKNGVRPQDVVEVFTSEAGVAAAAIGAIDMFGDFTFVEVQRHAASQILDRAPLVQLHGNEVHVTRAREKGEVKGQAPAPRKGARKPRA